MCILTKAARCDFIIVCNLPLYDNISGAILVFVTGDFIGGNNKMKYQEVFQLVPGAQSYYVHNDIFRLGQSLLL